MEKGKKMYTEDSRDVKLHANIFKACYVRQHGNLVPMLSQSMSTKIFVEQDQMVKYKYFIFYTSWDTTMTTYPENANMCLKQVYV